MVNWWLVLILVWDWCGLAIGRVGQSTVEKNLLASKRSSLLPLLLQPDHSLFRIKHQNFVGTLQFFKIDRQTPLSLLWARPFGMGRTDKPLLAVSIASKVLLQQRHDSAIPMLLTILTIVSIIQFVFVANNKFPPQTTIPCEPQLFLLESYNK